MPTAGQNKYFHARGNVPWPLSVKLIEGIKKYTGDGSRWRGCSDVDSVGPRDENGRPVAPYGVIQKQRNDQSFRREPDELAATCGPARAHTHTRAQRGGLVEGERRTERPFVQIQEATGTNTTLPSFSLAPFLFPNHRPCCTPRRTSQWIPDSISVKYLRSEMKCRGLEA